MKQNNFNVLFFVFFYYLNQVVQVDFWNVLIQYLCVSCRYTILSSPVGPYRCPRLELDALVVSLLLFFVVVAVKRNECEEVALLHGGLVSWWRLSCSWCGGFLAWSAQLGPSGAHLIPPCLRLPVPCSRLSPLRQHLSTHRLLYHWSLEWNVDPVLWLEVVLHRHLIRLRLVFVWLEQNREN